MGSSHCYCEPGVNNFLSISNKTGLKESCQPVLGRIRSIKCMLCFALFIVAVFLSSPVEGQDRRERTRSRGDGGIAFLMDNWLFRPGTSTSAEMSTPTRTTTFRQDIRRSRGRLAGVQRPPTTQESLTTKKLRETVHKLVPDIKIGTAPTTTLRKNYRKTTLHSVGEQQKTTLYKKPRPVTQRQRPLGTRRKIQGTEPTVTDRQVSIQNSIETSIQTPTRLRDLKTTKQKLRGTEPTLTTTKDGKEWRANMQSVEGEHKVDKVEKKRLEKKEEVVQRQQDEARIAQEEKLAKEDERKRKQRERLEKEKMIKEIKVKLKKQREAEAKRKLEEEKRKKEEEEQRRKEEEKRKKEEEEQRRKEEGEKRKREEERRKEEERKQKEEEKRRQEEEEKQMKEKLENEEKEEVTTQRQKRQEPKSEPENGDIYLEGGDVDGTGNIAIYR